jgi:hypothetical protein
VSLPGVSSAPPIPCTARAAKSVWTVVARPHNGLVRIDARREGGLEADSNGHLPVGILHWKIQPQRRNLFGLFRAVSVLLIPATVVVRPLGKSIGEQAPCCGRLGLQPRNHRSHRGRVSCPDGFACEQIIEIEPRYEVGRWYHRDASVRLRSDFEGGLRAELPLAKPREVVLHGVLEDHERAAHVTGEQLSPREGFERMRRYSGMESGERVVHLHGGYGHGFELRRVDSADAMNETPMVDEVHDQRSSIEVETCSERHAHIAVGPALAKSRPQGRRDGGRSPPRLPHTDDETRQSYSENQH